MIPPNGTDAASVVVGVTSKIVVVLSVLLCVKRTDDQVQDVKIRLMLYIVKSVTAKITGQAKLRFKDASWKRNIKISPMDYKPSRTTLDSF
jgi:hypothetical protein